VIAKLVVKGGLGNQLFQLSKAMEISSEFSRIEILDNTDNHETKRHFHLFEIVKQAGLQEFIISKLNFLDSSRISLAHKSKVLPSKIRYMVKSALGVTFDTDTTQIISKLNLFSSTIFDGYWQKNANTTRLENVLDRIIREDNFESLESLSDCIQVKGLVVVHVRGQDFLKDDKNFSMFGILSPEYYQLAFDFISPHFPKNKFKIVTDDKALAKFIFPQLASEHILGPESLSAMQALKFMSQAQNLIVGNSTLAWWAASLASRSKSKIFAPSSWRRDGNLNCPPSIINAESVPSKWLVIKPKLKI